MFQPANLGQADDLLLVTAQNLKSTPSDLQDEVEHWLQPGYPVVSENPPRVRE